MNILICDSYFEMSVKAAEFVSNAVSGKSCVLGLATGSTPEGMYAELCRLNANGKCDFSGVTTFNLDEYYPLAASDPESYHYFMDKHLFNKINIKRSCINIPDGSVTDPDAECIVYERKIESAGGIDLQVIGVGPNGHIGFNEPDGCLIPDTHVTALTDSTIEANSRFFASPDDVPKHALTMGIRTILSARHILALASGSVKHEALKMLISGKVTTQYPVTFLNLHRNVTLICDKQAYYGSDE